MPRKTLIINGSPRPKGDSAALIAELKSHLDGEVVEVSAFRSKISPCIDCRQCAETGVCVICDDMDVIYGDDYDNIVLAAPIYYGTLPGQVLSLLSRFQHQRAWKRVPGTKRDLRPKKSGLILVGGERHNPDGAMHHANVLFRMTNATGHKDHLVMSLDTDKIPAADDQVALAQVRDLAAWLNE